MGTPPFYFQDGSLFCEQTNVEELINSLPTRIHQIPVAGTLYAIKANGNLHIVKELKAQGVQMLIAVSGYEIVAGLKVGFLPEHIIFNGNGKQRWEVLLAIEQGVWINVDSRFDAEQIVQLSKQKFPEREVRVLLRVRPRPLECNLAVHLYVNTSESSKFGLGTRDMSQILEILQEHEKIRVEGIHCHLGSCIYDPKVYEYISAFVTELSATLAKSGIHVKLLDVGGAIGINYHGTLQEPTKEIPSLLHFIQPMSRILQKNLKVLTEPGRSLVGNSTILVTKVLGEKITRHKDYVVVDAAMTELIRPCLYGAHHRIYPTRLYHRERGKSNSWEWKPFDVVGPVCESGDFLGKDIPLQFPLSSQHLAIMDCGAYAGAMSSNYNMRPKATEIIVDGSS